MHIAIKNVQVSSTDSTLVTKALRYQCLRDVMNNSIYKVEIRSINYRNQT